MTTVFVVEDNVQLSLLYSRVLESAGLNVVQAKSCQEAFERLEEVVPSAMLLDLALPDGNGFSIVDYVNERPEFQNTRIAVLSGSDKYDHRSQREGVELFLQKPVSTPALLDTVKRLTLS